MPKSDRVDDDFFKLFYISDKLPTVFLEVKDRVNDELPWAVISDISPSFDVKDRNVQFG
jgi:hypothetical protein